MSFAENTNTAKKFGNKATATLTDNATGKSVDFPVIDGTVGPRVVDIRKLYNEMDMFTFDPGYTSTGSCESKITYIDGDKGELLYRGYPIEQLAEKSDFMEVAYLLLGGELPTPEQKAQFVKDITYHTMVHEQLASFLTGFRRDAHPMAVMCGLVGAMSAFYHDSTGYQRSAPARRREPSLDRQNADHGGHGLQIFERSAIGLSNEQARLCREFFAHDLFGAVRGICQQSDTVEGHG